MRLFLPVLAAANTMLVGCTESTKSPGSTDSGTGEEDTGSEDDTGFPAAEGCRAAHRDSEQARVVLVNLPFDGAGESWAVMDLDISGALSDTGTRVSAGAAFLGSGAFTPDGSLGVVAQDDGSIAIFAVDAAGTVAVVEPAWSSGFYASAVAIDPSGERAWVVDQNTVENGGGIYAVDLDCTDGTPSAADLPADTLGRFFSAGLPGAAVPVPGRFDRLLVVGGQDDGTDVSLLSVPDGAELDRIDAFNDSDDAWLTAADITPAGDLLLLTDTSAWSTRDNELAAIAIDGDSLVQAGVDSLFDGVAVRVGPSGSTALVSSGYDDAIVRVQLDASASDAARVDGKLLTGGGDPQLPGGMVSVQRGSLAGLALVAEVYGVRSVMMGVDGAATDLGVADLPSNAGALLVQP